DDLQLRIKDDVFQWQVGSKDFSCIDADTLLRADVCARKHLAGRVLKSCHGIGIIRPENGHPDTSKINSNLSNKIAIISQRKQRELVMLLFFMEEEGTRWRLLSAEEDDMRRTTNQEGGNADSREVRQALNAIGDQERILPSCRDASDKVRSQSTTNAEDLPRYSEVRRGTVA
ncbi:hypothetical protein EJ03DRAFT_276263, partial [Teratosphaeria nubilosa]